MTPQRATEILGRARGRRVLLVGDLMMDEWVFGSVKRISPEAPIPVVTMPLTPEARANKPGGAGNAAAILLGLGASLRVVGVVGDDELGARLLADLEARGADVSGVVKDPSRPTTHKMRVVASRQQILRIDTESADPVSAAVAAKVRDHLRRGIADAEVALAADYAKGLLTAESLPPEVIAAARAAGIPFCADPKPANVDLFRGAALVSPNEAEALAAAGPGDNGPQAAGAAGLPEAVRRAGQALRERLGADAVFVTRGDQGIAVFLADHVAQVPAFHAPGDLGDPTGCGDAVSAVSALALAVLGCKDAASYLEAATLANAAGAVVSRFVGVHSPQAEEICQLLAQAS